MQNVISIADHIEPKKSEKNVITLPFVSDEGETRSFWHVSPTGDYGNDCFLGEVYANQLMEYIAETGANYICLWVIRSMPNDYSGIETGFLHTIMKSSMQGFSRHASTARAA